MGILTLVLPATTSAGPSVSASKFIAKDTFVPSNFPSLTSVLSLALGFCSGKKTSRGHENLNI